MLWDGSVYKYKNIIDTSTGTKGVSSSQVFLIKCINLISLSAGVSTCVDAEKLLFYLYIFIGSFSSRIKERKQLDNMQL